MKIVKDFWCVKYMYINQGSENSNLYYKMQFNIGQKISHKEFGEGTVRRNKILNVSHLFQVEFNNNKFKVFDLNDVVDMENITTI